MPPWIRHSLVAVVMLCATIVGARVYLEMAGDAPPQQSPASHTAPDTLPEFTLNDLYGEPRNIREWAGRPLLINFWATWCAPCRREIPLLQQLHSEQDATGIQVIGVAIDRRDDVAAFAGEFGVSYPNLVGEADAMQVSGLFGLEGLGLPFTVVAAADGSLLTIHVGELDAAQLTALTATVQAHSAGRIDTAAAREQLVAL